jgi:hypothetical protein
MENKRYHVTWFIDPNRTILAGITVEATNVSEAMAIVCDRKIPIDEEKIVVMDDIKYIIQV